MLVRAANRTRMLAHHIVTGLSLSLSLPPSSLDFTAVTRATKSS